MWTRFNQYDVLSVGEIKYKRDIKDNFSYIQTYTHTFIHTWMYEKSTLLAQVDILKLF